MLLRKDIIFKIEAKAILEGLCLAWEKGIRQLDIGCDNALLVETIVDVADHMAKLTTTRFTKV
ncbi:hypothetical protein CXB51_018618 [Gossypium anomalum]|uniref:RNase H type-1 domain-containing protein n=1 Tax=Gossypium anomalum TaxID=47600 RepID=A0A8J5YDG4_9ROSI|nr:hypothetical protein CXB51_018618 [Gossypium anomalum]